MSGFLLSANGTWNGANGDEASKGGDDRSGREERSFSSLGSNASSAARVLRVAFWIRFGGMHALKSFSQHRPRLLRIAHRMLGSRSDAEDLVQDAYLRWHETDRSTVRVEEAFLVTMVTRLALDRLRRARSEREAYQGPWLPEPWLEGSTAELERSDELSYAAQVLLERLSPEERAAFLLRDIFEQDYALVADILGKSEAACRKLVQRANQQLAHADDGLPPRHAATREAQTQLLAQLMAASRAQDANALTELLSENARYVTDGGGKVFAARYPLEGKVRVARALFRIAQKAAPRTEERIIQLPGGPALVTYLDGALYSLAFLESRATQICTIYKLLNPEKLRGAAVFLGHEEG